LVKGLIEAHGGTITCTSGGAETGTEFSFTIPMASAGPAAVDARPMQPSERRRVLVVDDQPDVADMFASLLQSLGQDVAVAYDGASALALAREHRPEVAFLDVSMPDVGGSELASRLREEFPASELTLVAVTGRDRNDARVRDGGFDQHLLKPVMLESLVAVLNSAPRQDQEGKSAP
jgi:CheY-like chemotaxis protein